MMKNNFISASVNITDMDDEAKNYPIITQVEKDVQLIQLCLIVLVLVVQTQL